MEIINELLQSLVVGLIKHIVCKYIVPHLIVVVRKRGILLLATIYLRTQIILSNNKPAN